MPLTPQETVAAIADYNQRLTDFWGSAHGWAPMEAASLLSMARLDWQVELSRTLSLWLEPRDAATQNAVLILAWVNLGALVEGTMKWFLSVFCNDYQHDVDAIRDKLGGVRTPDALMLDPLRQFFQRRVWVDGDRWNAWVLHVQQRRNAIHSFRDRELGSQEEFIEDIATYFDFLCELDGRVPYP